MDRHTGNGLRLAALMGAGIGLMAASVLVALFPRERALSNAEIMDRARVLGMEQLTEMPPPEPSRGPDPAPAPQTQNPQLAVYIQDGAVFSQVAEMLKEAGAIADSAEFVERARERGLLNKLEVGVHLLIRGETADQVLDKVTRRWAP